ncbi:hypothetical protein ATANTOWER_023686, partial [Ataeniobius toweri]|nr:hypothetical protein [Ataeniobius toweri]
MEFIQPPSMMEKQTRTSKAKSENKLKEAAEHPGQDSLGALEQPAHNIQEASAEATRIISAISEVQSVPAPCDTEAAAATGREDCNDHNVALETATVLQDTESSGTAEPLKERPVEEVAARLAQQDQQEKNVIA